MSDKPGIGPIRWGCIIPLAVLAWCPVIALWWALDRPDALSLPMLVAAYFGLGILGGYILHRVLP